MTSDKKIAANRRNARKSTGPRTERGKRHSSGNALKQGFFAQRMLPFENKKEYEALLENLIAELAPQGQLEEFFVRQIAKIIHSHSRIDRAERQFYISVAKTQRDLRVYGTKYTYTVYAGPRPYAEAETEAEQDDAPAIEEIDIDNALSEGIAGSHEGEGGAKLEVARQRMFCHLRNYLNLLWALQEKRAMIDITPVAAEVGEVKKMTSQMNLL